jgi:hypothetical protein
VYLRDLPQEKNPKPLCLGKIFLFFYILTFLYKESMCGGSCTSGFFCCFGTALGLCPQVVLSRENTLIQVSLRVFPNLRRTHLYRNLEGQTKAWVMDGKMDARQMKITGAQITSYITYFQFLFSRHGLRLTYPVWVDLLLGFYHLFMHHISVPHNGN